MKNIGNIVPLWMIAPVVLGACVQIVGIEDPKPIDEKPQQASSSSTSSSGSSGSSTSSSGSSSSSSGSSTSSSGSSTSSGSGGDPGPWVNWPMPNPATAGLPNPSNYSVDMAKDIVTDNVTKLIWQRTIDSKSYVWSAAKTYCQNLVHAGYDDWRLPWRIEIASLIDYTKNSPAIDAAFPNTPNDGFWSASISASNSNEPWFVWFEDGDTYTTTATHTLRVRCVRSN